MLRWFEAQGMENDVVISSCVRLARNVREYNFSLKLSDEDAMKMIADIGEKLKNDSKFKEYSTYDFKSLDDCQKLAMKERHVISNFLLGQNIAAGLVSPEEDVSIMLNEEDHIRIQTYVPGMNMKKAYSMADKIDDHISTMCNYAYDEKYGYLTTCPSNVGTGMKASYMLHLPALASNNRITELAAQVGRFGLVLKGVHRNGRSSYGDVYKLSNQTTLGVSEEEIIDNLNHITSQIINQERMLRHQYIDNRKNDMLDAVYRSYGILRYARKLTIEDAMLLLSQLRLGLSEKLIQFDASGDFNVYQLMIGVMPANLSLLAGEDVSNDELDEYRAQFIRDNLPLMN